MIPLHISVTLSLSPHCSSYTDSRPEKKLDDEAAIREARKKEREEQHLYLWVKVITPDTFKAYGGTDLTNFDLTHSEEEPAAPHAYRLLRKSTFEELAVKVGEDTGVDPRRLRFWSMVNRQNKTVRPDAPVSDAIPNLDEALHRLSNKLPELRLWAETAEETAADGEPIWPSPYGSPPNGALPKTDLIVLFLKWFDPEKQTLNGVGHIYISREKKVEELVPAILKKMGWPEKSPTGEKAQLRLFEVSLAYCSARQDTN